ncbi:putative Phage tail tape measure protein [Methylocaldum szegediense]|uniref:Phage tail tape measure protein n=2 Tax=Methylocaldum szegediense TaxID=73780 RepID=A0ABM9I673_9GAMM|nr:putative Phage tail tape measure protein [Methylocaldum szegediense]
MNNRLTFIVSLLNRVSGPANQISQSLDRMTRQAEAGFQRIGYGVAGLVGAGYSVANLVGPARAMNNALSTVQALGGDMQTLTQLDKLAKSFSVEFGDSAADFVKSAAAIKSGIDDLTGDEIARFTYVGNLLAKSAESDAATITKVMTSMYNVFKQQADAMGRAEWVALMAAQVTRAAKIFRTDGQQMAEAFEGLAATATNVNRPMHEQVAVLGKLQGVFKGAEAATKYVSFLQGVGKAQEKLGLKFTDSQGKMLSVVEILERIRGKFGETFTVADADLLKKAFGRKEAVSFIQTLMVDLEGLKANIDEISQVRGLQDLTQMAQILADPFDRVTRGVEALRIAVGQKMIDAMMPTLNKIVEIEKRMIGWTDRFPKLTALIGKGTLAVFGLIAAISALSIAVGVSKFLMIGWQAAFGVLKFAILNMLPALGKFVAVVLFDAVPAIVSFTLALLANPITWIVIGIAALVAVIAAAVIYWDQWTSAVIEWASALGESSGLFALVDNLIEYWNKLPVWWDETVNWLIAKFDQISDWWTRFTSWLSSLNPFAGISAAIDGVLGKIAQIPGVGSLVRAIVPSAPSPVIVPSAPSPVPPPAALSASMWANVPAGGIANKISSKGGGFQFRDLHVNNYGQPMSGQQLVNELAFAAG